ncbi:MAG: hypothetical protein JSW39_14830 [Desulfobacterales bacterium]|nr:MAG: hypothetical protein JSW39_14830 [Desulfobacterales bacterium]
MKKISSIVNNENGSVIVVALLMLALLVIIGVASSNTSTTEVQIATNGQRYQLEFYVADSGWKDASMWLENRPGAPPNANPTGGDNIVKNFGSGTPADPVYTDLHELTPDNAAFGQYSIPYWYEVEHLPGLTAVVAGSGKNYRRHFYAVASNANETQQVEVSLSKIYKHGYK